MPLRMQALVGVSESAPFRLGRYDLVQLLGRGGMGMVFAARERDTGLEVAIKLMTWLDADAERRFREEFRAACEVRHDNLVRLHELASDQGMIYFAMELVRGVDIVAWARQGLGDDARGLREHTPPPTSPLTPAPFVPRVAPTARVAPRTSSARPLSEAKPLRDALAQLVRGVDALHARGILHLDLKPANVLVTPEGRVVILDFGLSRPTERAVTESNLLRGTPAYMAPEQVGGLALSPAADLYGVGGILYEMLTGLMPFEGWGTSALVNAKASLSIDPPDVLAPGTPKELADLAMALLHPEPSARPDAVAVLAALSAPTRVRPPSLAGPAPRTAFVGREREVETLRRASSDSRALRCLVVATLEGPSGIGKSALVAELSRHLAQDGWWFYGGRCYEREQVPYKGMDEIVAGLARHLRRLDGERLAHYLPTRASELLATFPALVPIRKLQEIARGTLATVDPRRAKRAAWDSLAEIFRGMATRRPLALFLDDAQWADAESLELLAFLVDALANTMTFVLLARRDDGPPLPALRAPMEVALTLGPLEERISVELARLHLRALGGDEAEATHVAEDAGGVPIHLEELSRYAAEHVHAPPRTEKVSLAALIRERIETLEPEARGLLATLALAEAPLPHGLVLAAAGLSPSDHPLLSDLVARRLARTSSTGVLTHHDRVRETMRAALDATETASRHLALARALSGEGASGQHAFAIVRHFAAAPELGEIDRRRAVSIALVAAEHGRAAGTLTLATEAVSRALSWCRDEDWSSARTLVVESLTRGADLAFLSGDHERALELVGRLEASPASALEKTEAREVALGVYIAQRRLDEAAALTHRAISELGHGLPDVSSPFHFDLAAIEALRALPLCTDATVIAASRLLQRAFSVFHTTDPALRIAYGQHLVALALENGVMPSTPMALAVAATTLNDSGREDLGHALSGVAREVLARVGDRRSEVPARLALDLFADVWVPPLFGSIARVKDDVVAGRRQLDVEYAARAASAYFRLGVYAGVPLCQLLAAHREWSDWLDPLQAQPGHGLLRLNLHLVRAFAGERAPLSCPSEGEPRSNLAAVEALTRGMLEAHFGDASAALAALELARSAQPYLASHWHLVLLRQFQALVALDAASHVRDELVGEALAALRHWASVSPENFAHRLALVEAELAFRGGAGSEAYTRAAELAERGDWLHDLGVVHERAGRRAAAIEAYERWGARAKVERLSSGAPLWAAR